MGVPRHRETSSGAGVLAYMKLAMEAAQLAKQSLVEELDFSEGEGYFSQRIVEQFQASNSRKNSWTILSYNYEVQTLNFQVWLLFRQTSFLVLSFRKPCRKL